ncbi:hypothetical protein AYI69_g5421, partial [Smittium culicis]
MRFYLAWLHDWLASALFLWCYHHKSEDVIRNYFHLVVNASNVACT